MSKQHELEQPNESYSHLMKIFHSSIEEKNLQDYSTSIFEAAAKDVQEDKLLNPGDNYKPQDYKSTKHLDQALDLFADNFEFTPSEKTQFTEKLKEGITANNTYTELKATLNEVRMQGVGKSNLQKMGAFFGIAARITAVPVVVAAGIASIALKIEASKEHGKAYSSAFQGHGSDTVGHAFNAHYDNKAAKGLDMSVEGLLDYASGPSDSLQSTKERIKKAFKQSMGEEDISKLSAMLNSINNIPQPEKLSEDITAKVKNVIKSKQIRSK